MTERHVCLALNAKKKPKRKKKEESRGGTGGKSIWNASKPRDVDAPSSRAKEHFSLFLGGSGEQDWEQWSRYQEGVTSFLYILYMYSVMKIQLVISHSLSFIWSKRAHDKWSMRNPSKLALCENMSHPCLSSTEWTSSAPQAPPPPRYLIVTLRYTKPREQGNLPKLGGISVKPKGDIFDWCAPMWVLCLEQGP